MLYNLNKLPVKTTNNFNVNDLKIDLEINELNTDKLYVVDGIEVKQEIKNKKITSRVGLEFNKYLEFTITVDKTYNKPILVNYNFENSDTLISNININYKANTKANFIFTYKSLDNNKHFNYLKEIVNMEENSLGTISYINLMSDNSTIIYSYEDKVLENASITHNLIDITGNIRIYNSYLESIGYNSKNYFNNIYLGTNNDLIDINYDLKNIGKRSINNLKVEGCLKDTSKKTFRGTIDFLEGSTKSEGIENENCILLSDTTRSRSLPMLLCHEEDVIGAHGESTGKIDKDKLFYLETRGLKRAEAEKLIVMANFTSIIDLIENDELKEEIIKRIEDQL